MGYRYRIEYTIKRIFFGLMNWCFPLIFSHMLGQEMYFDIDFHFLSYPTNWNPTKIVGLDLFKRVPSEKDTKKDAKTESHSQRRDGIEEAQRRKDFFGFSSRESDHTLYFPPFQNITGEKGRTNLANRYINSGEYQNSSSQQEVQSGAEEIEEIVQNEKENLFSSFMEMTKNLDDMQTVLFETAYGYHAKAELYEGFYFQ